MVEQLRERLPVAVLQASDQKEAEDMRLQGGEAALWLLGSESRCFNC